MRWEYDPNAAGAWQGCGRAGKQAITLGQQMPTIQLCRLGHTSDTFNTLTSRVGPIS